MIKRFEAETKIPANTVLQPREGTAKGKTRAIYVGAHRMGDGTYRYAIKHELKPLDNGQARWGSERLVTGNALVTGFDLRPYGWLPVAERAPSVRTIARRAEKGQASFSFDAEAFDTIRADVMRQAEAVRHLASAVAAMQTKVDDLDRRDVQRGENISRILQILEGKVDRAALRDELKLAMSIGSRKRKR